MTASANVELVRSIRSAWDRGDFSGSPGWADPDIEYVYVDVPDRGTSRRVPDMMTRLRECLGAWDARRVEADDYRALDDERVLVLTCPTATARRAVWRSVR